jgi:hypothetical protein
MASEKEMIPMHKRIAMGEKLDGQSLAPKGGSEKQPKKEPPKKNRA